RVKSGDHRSADNFSVAHHLRDAEGGENHTAHNVARKCGLVERKKTLEQRQAPLGAAWLPGLSDVGHTVAMQWVSSRAEHSTKHRRPWQCDFSNESRSKIILPDSSSFAKSMA